MAVLPAVAMATVVTTLENLIQHFRARDDPKDNL